MEQIEKYTDFLHTSFPRYSQSSEWFSKMSSLAFGKIRSIADWWNQSMTEFSCHSGTSNGGGHYIFTYIKSCQYTDHVVELKSKELSAENQELKLSISSLVQESYLKSKNMISENQELKSLIFGMLDEINELKEHNKCLSGRIQSLEHPNHDFHDPNPKPYTRYP